MHPVVGAISLSQAVYCITLSYLSTSSKSCYKLCVTFDALYTVRKYKYIVYTENLNCDTIIYEYLCLCYRCMLLLKSLQLFARLRLIIKTL